MAASRQPVFVRFSFCSICRISPWRRQPSSGASGGGGSACPPSSSPAAPSAAQGPPLMVRPDVKSAITVAAICGLIAAAVYPIVVVPLQDRSTREAPAGGFSKGSMWSNVDSAARSK